jgi:uncharacterized protein (TIGR03067 family)
MKTLRFLPLAAVLTALAPATLPADEPALKGDLARLQGEWEAKVGPDRNIPLRVVFQGNKATLNVKSQDGKAREMKGEFRLNEQAKPHKTIDWTNFSGANGQSGGEDHGIYELDGDTFKVCSGGPGNARPTDFQAGADGQGRLVVFQRVHKSD